MRDDEFKRKLDQVDAILEDLREGDITQKQGEQLKQDALQLLDEAEELLSVGQKKAVEVREQDDKISESSMKISRTE